jgi:uncharacterized protein YbcI
VADGHPIEDMSAATEPQAADAGPDGALNAAIARAVVRTYRTIRGRGPTKARTLFRDDVIVVILQDVMTPSERSLVGHGWLDQAQSAQQELQAVMRPALVEAVETLTGARVRAAMSQSHGDPDMAVEVFVLDRAVGGPPPRPVGL